MKDNRSSVHIENMQILAQARGQLTSVSFRQRRRILIQYLRERTAKM
jgi:hypothetical protein